jgi:hypothetical protein
MGLVHGHGGMARVGGASERPQKLGITIVGAMHDNVSFQTHRYRRSLMLAVPATALLLMCGCGSSSKPKTGAGATATHATQTTPVPATPAQTTTTATSSATGNVVSASVGSVSATLHAATHHPKVQVPWPIHFAVTRGGAPAHASVSYEYLFAGQVVAHRSHYTFTGGFSDTFHWPSSAVGYPLTFRAVIVSAGVTINLDYPVQVVG